MKKTYETPSVEKIAFRYRDQVVAASGDVSSSSNIFQSSEFGSCYSAGEALEYVFGLFLGECGWFG